MKKGVYKMEKEKYDLSGGKLTRIHFQIGLSEKRKGKPEIEPIMEKDKDTIFKRMEIMSIETKLRQHFLNILYLMFLDGKIKQKNFNDFVKEYLDFEINAFTDENIKKVSPIQSPDLNVIEEKVMEKYYECQIHIR